MLDTLTAAPSSVLAFVTTIHAALLVLLLQRCRGIGQVLCALPTAALGAAAWILPAPAWLVGGVVTSAAWTLVAVRAAGRRPHGAEGEGSCAPRRPRFVPALVLSVTEETDTIRTFRLARPPGFEFQAGQFLMVRLNVDGRRIARCYSITSPPGARDYLEISVRRQGLVSGALHDTLRAGSTLFIHPPLGRFTLPADARVPLVLVAGGIGITPLIGMVRHVIGAEADRRMTLLYSARTSADLAFREELRGLSAGHPHLRAVLTVTGGPPREGERAGRIDAALIREFVPDPAGSLFLLCGPIPMIDALGDALRGLGVPGDHIRAEAFEAAAAMASRAAPAAAPEGSGGRLRLAATGNSVEVAPSETLLEAAERAGASIPSFCRAGMCGTCRTRLVSGEVRCTGDGLSDEERQRGEILPCVAWPSGDCVLEA